MVKMEENPKQFQAKALHQILECMAKVFDLDSILQAVIGVLTESLAARRAVVALRDEETGKLVIRAFYGLHKGRKDKRGYWRSDRIAELLPGASAPFVFLRDLAEPLFPDDRMLERMDKECVQDMGSPLLLSGAAAGVILVDRVFGEDIPVIEDIGFLSAIAGLLSQSIGINREILAREKMLEEEKAILHREVAAGYHSFTLLGTSRSITEVRQLIWKVARSNAPVLLLGEHGVGKTLTARIIHEMSPRARKPFVKINCASLPESELDVELFGDAHEGPAASGSRWSAFGGADGGVVFLDDIEDLPVSLQAKLVRFLQRREFECPKGDGEGKAQVRIMAAASANLSEKMQLGLFKEDLYYRLNVFPIEISPLRERTEDIPAIVEYFHERACREHGRRFFIDSQCIDILKENDWPGNVRELENFIERLAIMAGCVSLDSEEVRVLCRLHGKQMGLEKKDSLSRLEEMERKEIAAALERNRWIQSQAARELGLTLRQVGYRIKKFGLDSLVQRRKSG
jgi:Nif-specific regulatory protein